MSIEKSMEKYDKLHAGKALYNYINGVNVTRTKLGELSRTTKDGPKDLVASGHQIFDVNDKSLLESPMTIYTRYATLSSNTAFKNNFDESISLILKHYLDVLDLDQEVKDDLVNKLKDINKKKLLIIPIKPKSVCKITYTLDNVKETRVLSKVKYLKWNTNKATFELECTVAFESASNGVEKTVKIPLTEYCRSILPEKLEYWNGIGTANKSLIEMTNLGMIKPIEIADGFQSIIADGTYIYWIHNGQASVIGEWNQQTGGLVISPDALKTLQKTDLFKAFTDNLALISGHRRLIAPYNLCPLHKYNIREAK